MKSRSRVRTCCQPSGGSPTRRRSRRPRRYPPQPTGFVAVDEYLATSVPGVYATGDVKGGRRSTVSPSTTAGFCT
ncbi:FAD-dependent oxidoreductase [Streptomyces sp. NPDC051014]|uniref:FAD-dependent oxidoreductase n=1 Tax=Streptomyces sp. NPDC051014 TaxID=3155751 RepID=UPI0033C05F20